MFLVPCSFSTVTSIKLVGNLANVHVWLLVVIYIFFSYYQLSNGRSTKRKKKHEEKEEEVEKSPEVK